MPQPLAVDPVRRRTRLTHPLDPVGRVDGQARRSRSRPLWPRRPVPRYGAVSGRYRSRRARSPSTERRGRAVPHREPSLRCVATAKRACRAATDAVKTRRVAEMRFSPMFAAREVPSNSPNFSQISVKFRKFGIDDRSYRDYMKLAEFGKLANFTRTFANLSDAKFSESSR